MKKINFLFTLVLYLIFSSSLRAQNYPQCAHCNMDIRDRFHEATAENKTATIHFDAIECLINYLKTNDENTFTMLKVADYISGKLTNAKTATYLKSKAISSPMGASLSAFISKNEAIKTKNKKGGEVYTWEEIKDKFKNSNFGISHSHHNHFRPDAHAPIGVMRDHLHKKGGLMLTLRYMNMVMDGNKAGISTISDANIFDSYKVSPQKMTMDMYMLGVMYAPSNKFTLMAMQSVVKKSMDLTVQMVMNGMPMKRNFTTSASGLGDLNLSALYSIFNTHQTSLHLNTGVNIPIGNIQNHANTPMLENAKLPYAMQLGSGTFDAQLGVTYKKNYKNISWGTQLLSTFRTGKNSEGYRFGNLHQLNIWGAYNVSTNISLSARLLGVSKGKINGIDPDLNPMMVTTANTSNYGSTKIKSFIGTNIAFPETSSMRNLRIGLEAGIPVYENYNGIQMDESLSLIVGLKYFIL